MFAIFNFLNAHNLPIFQPILMILVSKFMVHRALSDKTYVSLGLLSPLKRTATLNASLSEMQANMLQAISNRMKKKNVTDVCIVNDRKQWGQPF